MNRDTLEQDPCNTCGYEEGSIYCKEHCPHEAKIEQEPVFFPPCQDCNTKMDEIRRAYDKLQKPCGNTIDRAEAMTEIMMFAENVKSDEEDIYIKVSDAVQLLRELPPVNPTKTGWIPVSERLPEEGQWVMVTFDGKIAVCIAHDNDGTLREATSLVLKNATEIWLYPESEWGDGYAAWMPLPEPYEPQERRGKG